MANHVTDYTEWVVDENNDLVGYRPRPGAVAAVKTLLSPTADIAAQINAAISSVSATGGGVVEIAAGTYSISTAILMASGVTLRGQGGTKIRAIAAMVNDDTSNTNTNLVYLYQVSDCAIENIEFDGARTLATTGDDGQGGLDAGRNCIRGFGSARVRISGCKIHDAVFHGVFADESCSDWIITNNDISANGFRAVHIHAQGSDAGHSADRHVVSNNVVRQNGASSSSLQASSLSGLYCCFDNAAGIVIANNTIYGEDGAGIELRGSNDAAIAQTGTTASASAVITGLTSTTNMRVGMIASGTGVVADSRILTVDSATQITLTKACTANGSVTITFRPLAGRESVVTGNTIRGCTSSQISVTDWAQDLVISNNVIADGGGRAISIDAAASKRVIGVSVTGNTITNHLSATQGYGILIDEAERVSVVGNTISGCVKEGISATSCDQVVISGNCVVSGDSYAIRTLSGDRTMIVNNHCTTRATATIDIGGSVTNCVCNGNYVTRTGTGAGIVNASATTTLFGNKLGPSTTVTPGGALGPTFNQVTAAGANTGTLTNSPVSGNPAEWISIVGPSGTARSIPAW